MQHKANWTTVRLTLCSPSAPSQSPCVWTGRWRTPSGPRTSPPVAQTYPAGVDGSVRSSGCRPCADSRSGSGRAGNCPRYLAAAQTALGPCLPRTGTRIFPHVLLAGR